ncbi:hypothetical protein ABK040_000519 [Willaertia magna]
MPTVDGSAVYRVLTFPTPEKYTETPLLNEVIPESSLFYTTMDNGGLPFLIEIKKDQQQVNIYENAYSQHAGQLQNSSQTLILQEMTVNGKGITRKGFYYYHPFEKYAYWYALIKEIKQNETPFEIFVGIDNHVELYEWGSTDSTINGGSVLIHFKSSNECWHIGIDIVKFKLEEKIENLYSTVGNSAVIYPYIVTDKNVIVIEGSDIYSCDKSKLTNVKDFYEHFYQNRSAEWKQLTFISATPRQIDKNIRDPTLELFSL